MSACRSVGCSFFVFFFIMIKWTWEWRVTFLSHNCCEHTKCHLQFWHEEGRNVFNGQQTYNSKTRQLSSRTCNNMWVNALDWGRYLYDTLHVTPLTTNIGWSEGGHFFVLRLFILWNACSRRTSNVKIINRNRVEPIYSVIVCRCLALNEFSQKLRCNARRATHMWICLTRQTTPILSVGFADSDASPKLLHHPTTHNPRRWIPNSFLPVCAVVLSYVSHSLTLPSSFAIANWVTKN